MLIGHNHKSSHKYKFQLLLIFLEKHLFFSVTCEESLTPIQTYLHPSNTCYLTLFNSSLLSLSHFQIPHCFRLHWRKFRSFIRLTFSYFNITVINPICPLTFLPAFFGLLLEKITHPIYIRTYIKVLTPLVCVCVCVNVTSYRNFLLTTLTLSLSVRVCVCECS